MMMNPKMTEPSTAPMNAPTIPPHSRSGRNTVKCHTARPIMTHANIPMVSGSFRACGCAAFASWAPTA